MGLSIDPVSHNLLESHITLQDIVYVHDISPSFHMFSTNKQEKYFIEENRHSFLSEKLNKQEEAICSIRTGEKSNLLIM